MTSSKGRTGRGRAEEGREVRDEMGKGQDGEGWRRKGKGWGPASHFLTFLYRSPHTVHTNTPSYSV